MATEFNTQTGNGEYRLQFETDNKDYYLLMQETARRCVDGKPQTNGDKIRAMSDEELVEHFGEFMPDDKFCTGICNEDHDCDKCRLEWLKQPVEVEGNA